jgi:hypothetical protein
MHRPSAGARDREAGRCRRADRHRGVRCASPRQTRSSRDAEHGAPVRGGGQAPHALAGGDGVRAVLVRGFRVRRRQERGAPAPIVSLRARRMSDAHHDRGRPWLVVAATLAARLRICRLRDVVVGQGLSGPPSLARHVSGSTPRVAATRGARPKRRVGSLAESSRDGATGGDSAWTMVARSLEARDRRSAQRLGELGRRLHRVLTHRDAIHPDSLGFSENHGEPSHLLGLSPGPNVSCVRVLGDPASVRAKDATLPPRIARVFRRVFREGGFTPDGARSSPEGKLVRGRVGFEKRLTSESRAVRACMSVNDALVGVPIG